MISNDATEVDIDIRSLRDTHNKEIGNNSGKFCESAAHFKNLRKQPRED